MYDSNPDKFQSRSGFSPCFDEARSAAGQSSTSFNPGLGFLPASTGSASRCRQRRGGFQSRSGFSPCFDRPRRPGRPASSWVSIPVWVFSLLRRRHLPAVLADERRFNPGLGFLPASTPPRPAGSRRSAGFNPGLGFLPASTFGVARESLRGGVVSIPVWVFSLLRHGLVRARVARERVSIPVWVFSLLRLLIHPG